jgi:hypothetical protein
VAFRLLQQQGRLLLVRIGLVERDLRVLLVLAGAVRRRGRFDLVPLGPLGVSGGLFLALFGANRHVLVFPNRHA